MRTVIMSFTIGSSKTITDPKASLLKRLPKQYHDRVKDFTIEDDLVDDCKYMLYWTNEYTDSDGDGYGGSYPVRSIKEAIDFIKNSLFR